MVSQWEPYREPLRVTVLRTGIIAVVAGGVVASLWGGLARWPMVALLMLWPAFGGHWVEVWFLNGLRPKLPVARVVQVGARLGVWFVGGVILAVGMDLTARAMGHAGPGQWSVWGTYWWVAGAAFIGVELVAHGVLQLRGRASFYNGRG